MLQGATVLLHVKTRTGTDPFGVPVWEDMTVPVEDVLIGQPTTEEVTDTLNLTGRTAVYRLAIPKGDDHVWENTLVELPPPMAGLYRTVGIPVAGIEENIPLRWNMKVYLERFG